MWVDPSGEVKQMISDSLDISLDISDQILDTIDKAKYNFGEKLTQNSFAIGFVA
jgi:hypothetical protein